MVRIAGFTLALVVAAAVPAFPQTPAPPALTPQTELLASRGLAAIGAGPNAGFVGTGTVELADGSTGSVALAAWGASHCKLSITWPPRIARPPYTAIVNGVRLQIIGPQTLIAAPPSVTPRAGCALLPQALPWADAAAGKAFLNPGNDASSIAITRAAPSADSLAAPVTVELDPNSGLPASASWSLTRLGITHTVTISYANYTSANGVSYPSRVTESLDGTVLLSISFTGVSSHPGFSDADFPAPPPLAPHRVPAGGAR